MDANQFLIDVTDAAAKSAGIQSTSVTNTVSTTSTVG